jgi:hypothetical protein
MNQLPNPPRPLHAPRQDHKDQVLRAIRKANEIFEQCRIKFKVCETIVLDTSQVTIGDRKMADLFAADGTLTIGGSHPMPSDFLSDFKTNGPAAFNEKMRKKCVHLFFVHDLRYDGATLPEQGSGGWFPPAGERTCYAMVSARATDLVQTIAHEFVHALGIEGHSTAEGNLMKEAPGEDDRGLDAATQCPLILQTLTDHIQRGCD